MSDFEPTEINETEILLSMLDAAAADKASDFRDTFDSVMQLKVNELVNQRKEQIAAELAGGGLEDEEIQEEEVELTDEELDEILESLTDEEAADLLEELEEEEKKKLSEGSSDPSTDEKGRDGERFKALKRFTTTKRFKAPKLVRKGLGWVKRTAKRLGISEVKQVSSARLPRGMTIRKTPNPTARDDYRNMAKGAVPDGKGNWYTGADTNKPVGLDRTKTSMATSDAKFRKNGIKNRRRGPSQYNLFDKDINEGSSSTARQKRVGDSRIRKAGDIDWGVTSPSKDRKGRSEGQYNRIKDLYKKVTGIRRAKTESCNEVVSAHSSTVPKRGFQIRTTGHVTDKDNSRDSVSPDFGAYNSGHLSKVIRYGSKSYINKADPDRPMTSNNKQASDSKIRSAKKPEQVPEPKSARRNWIEKSRKLRLAKVKEGYNQKHPGWDRITSTVSDYDKKKADQDAKTVGDKAAAAKKTYSKALVNYMKAQGKNPDGSPLKEDGQLDWARKQLEKKRARVLGKKTPKTSTPIKETSDDTVKKYAQAAKGFEKNHLAKRLSFVRKFKHEAPSAEGDGTPIEPKPKKLKPIGQEKKYIVLKGKTPDREVTDAEIAAARDRFKARLAATAAAKAAKK